MVTHPDLAAPSASTLHDRVAAVSREDANRFLDAAGLSDGLLGAPATANILLLGAAVQAGAVPVPPDAIERAIELNGVAVESNLAAFTWGRAWVDDAIAVETAAGFVSVPPPETVYELTDRLAHDLTDYQSDAYANRFRKVVDRARAAERAVDAGSTAFTEAVARNLHKLMAYKDEYEVARLLLADEAVAGYEAVGGSGAPVTYHLHPPMLRAIGVDRKLRLQRTALPALRALRASKRLRGTPADPFRWAEVRRVERAMIPEYIDAVDRIAAHLHTDTIADAIEIAELPDQVRGYEDIKLRRAARYRAELSRRLA
jgi:indolepyruvate ferredoxin oxidoreductase